MWAQVTRDYRWHRNVYFEPMNEPFGYTLDEWVRVNSGWIHDHRSIPRNRIVVSGTGYNDDVTGVGAAKELKGTLLSLHFYGFWGDATTVDEWTANLTPRVGQYAGRTIVDEAGSPMTIGLNYGATDGDVSTAYMAALTRFTREHRMGLVYWPGLRTGDSYSMETLQDDGTLVDNSETGVARLKWAWGYLRHEPSNDDPPAPEGAALTHSASGRCLDIPGQSTTPGTGLDLWDCNGGANQSWNPDGDQQLTIYASRCVQSAGEGGQVTIEECTGADDQRWTVSDTETGALSPVSDPSLCLAPSDSAAGNGTEVILAACTGGEDQVWSLAS